MTRGFPATLAVVVLFLVLGWSDGHYWDEFFYLYSSYAHTPAELVRYELGTGLFPVGFFSEKIGHVALLHFLSGWLGGSEAGLYTIQVLYAALLVAGFAAAYGLLRDLLGRRLAREAVPVLLLSPLALYLAYKTLSEVPSLLLVTVSCWAFVRGCLAPPGGARRGYLVVAAVTLAAGALCRVTAVVEFAGLGVALLVAGDERFDRRQVLIALLGTGIAGALLHTLGLALVGGTVLPVVGHARDVITSHSPMQRVYALGCFVQTFALALPFVWPLRRERGVVLIAVWLLAAALPFTAGHEPRYYAPALVPFAVLAGSGLREAARRLAGAERAFAWVGLLAGLLLVNRLVFRPLMPYEVEQSRLLALYDRDQARDPGGTELTAWISDYSLLRFTHPRDRVRLCLSREPGERVSGPRENLPLSPIDQWWAEPGHYVGGRSALAAQPRPWRYLGWDYSPPALRLQQLLLRASVRAAKVPKLHDHLEGSWIWHDPALVRTPIDSLAQYRVFRIELRS